MHEVPQDGRKKSSHVFSVIHLEFAVPVLGVALIFDNAHERGLGTVTDAALVDPRRAVCM